MLCEALFDVLYDVLCDALCDALYDVLCDVLCDASYAVLCDVLCDAFCVDLCYLLFVHLTQQKLREIKMLLQFSNSFLVESLLILIFSVDLKTEFGNIYIDLKYGDIIHGDAVVEFEWGSGIIKIEK